MRSCPRHGTKWIEKTEEGHLICMAPIPKDKYGLRNCYYEIPNKPGPKPVEVCSKCNMRKPEYGTVCGECRREYKREAYRLNKKKTPFAKR